MYQKDLLYYSEVLNTLSQNVYNMHLWTMFPPGGVRTFWDGRDVCEVHPSPSAGTLCHSPCGPWARGSFLHYTSYIPL